jgi:hypothetical protein
MNYVPVIHRADFTESMYSVTGRRLYIEDRKAEAAAMTADLQAPMADMDSVLAVGISQRPSVWFASLKRPAYREHVELATTLIVRESTAPPRRPARNGAIAQVLATAMAPLRT